ncbi:MAG: transcriptional repressor [Thermodesulforhabdaceae bacterium]
MRMTIQRKIILDTIRHLKTHPTADELYTMIKPRLPRISLATVYRNLEMLASEGFIQKLTLHGSTQKRFDGNPHFHAHAQCIRCGKIEDIMMDPRLDPKAYVKEAWGFDIQEWTIEFRGLCSECKASQEERQERPSQKEDGKHGREKSKRNTN